MQEPRLLILTNYISMKIHPVYYNHISYKRGEIAVYNKRYIVKIYLCRKEMGFFSICSKKFFCSFKRDIVLEE